MHMHGRHLLYVSYVLLNGVQNSVIPKAWHALLRDNDLPGLAAIDLPLAPTTLMLNCKVPMGPEPAQQPSNWPEDWSRNLPHM